MDDANPDLIDHVYWVNYTLGTARHFRAMDLLLLRWKPEDYLIEINLSMLISAKWFKPKLEHYDVAWSRVKSHFDATMDAERSGRLLDRLK